MLRFKGSTEKVEIMGWQFSGCQQIWRLAPCAYVKDWVVELCKQETS